MHSPIRVHVTIDETKLGFNFRGCYSSRTTVRLFCLRNEWNHRIIVGLGGVGFREITTSTKSGKSQHSSIARLCDWITVANLTTHKEGYFGSVCPAVCCNDN